MIFLVNVKYQMSNLRLNLSDGAVLWSCIEVILHLSNEVCVELLDSVRDLLVLGFPQLSILGIWVAKQVGEDCSDLNVINRERITGKELFVVGEEFKHSFPALRKVLFSGFLEHCISVGSLTEGLWTNLRENVEPHVQD